MVFQQEFATVAKQLAASKEQVLEARKDLAVAQASGKREAEDGGDDARAALRKAKAEFSPTGAGGSSASKLLKGKKKASAAAF